MTGAEDIPLRLLEHLRKTVGEAKADESYPLIVSAAHQLECAALGEEMHRLALPTGDNYMPGFPMWVVGLAAQNLVYRCVTTSIDLCAAVIYRLSGGSVTDREADMGWWKCGLLESLPVEPPYAQWLNTTKGSHLYRPLIDLREAVTHRVLGQSVNVNLGGGGAEISAVVGSGSHEIGALMREMNAFGLYRYAAFESAVQAVHK